MQDKTESSVAAREELAEMKLILGAHCSRSSACTQAHTAISAFVFPLHGYIYGPLFALVELIVWNLHHTAALYLCSKKLKHIRQYGKGRCRV